MLENKLNTNKNVLLPEQERRRRREENNKNYDNTFIKRKIKTKKEPLPMKLRALPESFWQQPNEPSHNLPGTIYPDLPVITDSADSLTLTGTTYINNETSNTSTINNNNEIVSTANTELLFSLFSVIDTETNNNSNNNKMSVIRRGRPKKTSLINKNKNVLRDKDPCLISTVTEALLPLLPEREMFKKHGFIEQQAFLTFSVNTAITPGQSYSHLLSEVVVRL